MDSLKTQLKAAFGNAYVYESAEDADEAIEFINELSEDEINVIVIVSDWLMPKIKGDDFLIRVYQRFLNLIKIMLTCQADDSAIKRTQEQANLYDCLFKLWSDIELVATLKSALAKLSLNH